MRLKKMLTGGVGILAGAWVATVWAASTDAGFIDEIYTGDNGYFAVMLPGGYPNAVSASECPGANGWAGVNADPSNKDIKVLLMMAKITERRVRIVVQGCEAGGAWFKIAHVYVE